MIRKNGTTKKQLEELESGRFVFYLSSKTHYINRLHLYYSTMDIMLNLKTGQIHSVFSSIKPQKLHKTP